MPFYHNQNMKSEALYSCRFQKKNEKYGFATIQAMEFWTRDFGVLL